MRIQVNSLPFFGRRKFTERLMLFFRDNFLNDRR